MTALLRGKATNYAVRGQDASGLSFGGAKLAVPPTIDRDIEELVGKGVAVYAVREDMEQRGIKPGDLVPDDPLIDQSGATRRLSDWRGRALAVTFVYTRCPLPDFCPAVDRGFAALQKAIKEDGRLATRVHLVTVSFDPAHDTPVVIRRHAEARGADPAVWSYMTGAAAAIDRSCSSRLAARKGRSRRRTCAGRPSGRRSRRRASDSQRHRRRRDPAPS